MRIIRTQAEMDSLVAQTGAGVLVPTMGALHAGHTALIGMGTSRAREMAAAGMGNGECIVSIFVNPTQFDDARDFARYPRVLEADLALCETAGATAVFAPSVETMYPPGVDVRVPALPPVATEPGLEDAHRPGHFRGVCQVVRRLFEIVRPAAAVFGEKDWQQLQVIRAMTAAEGLAVEIIAAETVREGDGLAMSSRNVFLSEEERWRAGAMYRALHEGGANGAIGEAESRSPGRSGGESRLHGELGVDDAIARRSDRSDFHPSQADAEAAMRRVLEEAGIEVEYATIREARRLIAVRDDDPSRRRALVAGRLGSVRLIDNATWP